MKARSRPPARLSALAGDTQARPGAIRRIPVMRLAGTFEPGLTGALVARVTRPGQRVGTVVADLGDGAGIDGEAGRELRSLQDMLRSRGTSLRLAVTSDAVRRALTAGAAHRIGPLTVHQTPRAAVLAACAELPGPGFVNAYVRAALAGPAETLVPPAHAGRGDGPRSAEAQTR